MKAVKVKCKFGQRKQTETQLIQFQLFIFYKPAYLQKNFDRRQLYIRVFSSDGHNGLKVSLRGLTLSRHVINLNQ